ncbi:hypothetical protein P0Y35_08060 [Kiritimatiellaeota bacterium B1221]|nr:hypothetical protein [Kiritimatiellaeota bacterium B1221]
MKKIFYLSVMMLFGNILAAEAVTQTESETPPGKSIMPRVEGAVWTYASYWQEEGKKVLSGTVTEEIVKVLKLEGETCYKIKKVYDYRSIPERLAGVKLTEDDMDFFWEYANAKGSYNFAERGEDTILTPQDLNPFSLTLPYPVKKGHKYKAEGSDWSILDTAEKVTVAAGTFSCVVYESVYRDGEEDGWSRARFYMSPGVGLVCLEFDYREEGKWVLDTRDELMKFVFPGGKEK